MRVPDQSVTTQSNWGEEGNPTPTVAVVEALSEATGVPADDLPPLYEYVDTDALNGLFEGRRTTGFVRFQVGSWVVLVHADEYVRVYSRSPGGT